MSGLPRRKVNERKKDRSRATWPNKGEERTKEEMVFEREDTELLYSQLTIEKIYRNNGLRTDK